MTIWLLFNKRTDGVCCGRAFATFAAADRAIVKMASWIATEEQIRAEVEPREVEVEAA